MDPVWTEDNHILFTSFEGLSFSVRHLADVDSLRANPVDRDVVDLSGTGKWSSRFAGSLAATNA